MERTIEQLLQQGVAAHAEGKLQEAERLYRAILQSQRLHPDANHNLGVLAVSVNKSDAALPLFKNALEANPKIEQFWLSYIDALIKEEQFDNAKQVLEQGRKFGLVGDKVNALEAQLKKITQSVLPKSPEKEKSLTPKEKGKKLSEQKKKKAKKQNLKSNNPSPQQLSNLLEHYQSGRFHDAAKLAASITNEFPKHQFGWKILGAVLGPTGRKSEAVDANRTAVALSPQDAEVHYNLGNTLKELARLDEALASYRQALALNPGFARVHSNLGNTLQKLGRLDEALASHKQAIALKPDLVEAHYNLGITLKELGRLDEALVSYNQAIVLKPDFAEAHSNLGNTLKELGRLDEALASYNQAIALKPDFTEAHYNLGNTLKELGRLDEALASYNQAITLKPDLAEAHANLGATLKELGKLDEAQVSLTQAIALTPDYADALYNRSHLLFEKAQYEAALRDADACILKKAKVRSLTSLYALGRVSEIYKRLELHSKSDAENISLAAFATFIAEVEKKPTAYNFCPNPLDFIHITNFSSHVTDSVAYVEGIIGELNKTQTIWEPSGKTTNNGFQSLNGMNLFKNPDGKIGQLKTIIIDEIEAYYLKYKNEQCLYIQEFPTMRNLFGWTVTLKQQGHQNAHIHSSGWLSGVIYLKVVPSLGKNEGAIEFSLNSKDYQNDNSPSLTFQPEVGDIVFFPSSLHHKTIPFTTDVDRIIVSFDLIPKAAKHLVARLT